MTVPHECDEHCVCPVHRCPMIYVPVTDDHACDDKACEYGLGTWKQMAGQQQRRADRLARACNSLTDEVMHGLATDAHHKVMQGGLPFCSCGWPLLSGDCDGDFITHAITVVKSERGQGIPYGGHAEVEWSVWRDCGLAKGGSHQDGDHAVLYYGNHLAGAWATFTHREKTEDNLVMVAREVTCGPWTKVEP